MCKNIGYWNIRTAIHNGMGHGLGIIDFFSLTSVKVSHRQKIPTPKLLFTLVAAWRMFTSNFNFLSVGALELCTLGICIVM